MPQHCYTKSEVCVCCDVNLFIFAYDAKDSTVTFPLVQRHIRRYRLMDFYFYHCHGLLLTLSLTHSFIHSFTHSLAFTLIFNWKLLNASDSMDFHWMECSRLIIKKKRRREKKRSKREKIRNLIASACCLIYESWYDERANE